MPVFVVNGSVRVGTGTVGGRKSGEHFPNDFRGRPDALSAQLLVEALNALESAANSSIDSGLDASIRGKAEAFLIEVTSKIRIPPLLDNLFRPTRLGSGEEYQIWIQQQRAYLNQLALLLMQRGLFTPQMIPMWLADP